jgi:hypothetical protein
MGHIKMKEIYEQEMNDNWPKFNILLAIIVLMGASGCLETPVKINSINHSQVLVIEGEEEWKLLVEEYPMYRGIDLYKNAGYGVTKVTFEYIYNSGRGTILQAKNNIDYTDKSRADYYVSGIRLLLKKDSGDVYDTGMVFFQKDESTTKTISLPKEKFLNFRVKEIEISPRN